KSPSQAAERIAPLCTRARRSAPSLPTNSRASSPSTNTEVSRRKWIATTAAGAATGRGRSTTEASGLRVSDMRDLLAAEPRRLVSGDAALEAGPDLLFRQLLADEHDAALALLAVLPGALVIAVEDHVHALEHEALGIVLEREDALGTQDRRPVFGDELLDPGEEPVGVERLVGLQRQRLHVLVVIVLEPVVARIVIVVVVVAVMMIVVLIMVMIVTVLAFEERRLDVEDAVEIEGIAAEHLGQGNGAALCLVQPRILVDGADARLDLGELVPADEVGLVEQDDVGEGDLVLRFGGVLEAFAQPFGVRDGDHGVELGAPVDVAVGEDRLRDRRGVGEAGGLADDGVELALPAHQPVDDADEVAAHGAADAAVVHLEHLFVRTDDEVVVDADLAEFVDDDGVFLAVRLGQDAVEEDGLAGAEVAGRHCHGDLVGHPKTPVSAPI